VSEERQAVAAPHGWPKAPPSSPDIEQMIADMFMVRRMFRANTVRGEYQWSVSYDLLGVQGQGKTFEDAVRMAHRHFTEHYEPEAWR
jgi:hypothetical protein